jgi:glycosyltransferase involved in cell wall biosynthesis
MSPSPAFTVVVPARDAEWSIEETISSILMQSLQDFEIVVVDDGSTDRTAEVARAIGGERVRIERAEGVGVSAARNRGVAAAHGRLVSFLDSDDLWLPSYLEEMANAFARDPGLGLAYTDAWVLDELAGAIRRQPMMARRRPDGELPTDAEAVFSLLIEGNFVYTSATVPRTVLERVGGYEETLSRAEDYDLWLRIVEAGYPASYLPGPLAVYRLRAGSLSTDRLAMLKGECAALRNLLERDALSSEHRSIVSTRIAELTERIGALETGPARKSSLPRRVWTRLERVRREGPLYREPPPEIAGGFPDLAYSLRAVRRMSKRIA